MALSIDMLNSCTVPFYAKAFVNQVYEKNVLLDRIRSGGRIKRGLDGGTHFRIPIRHDEFNQAKMIDPDDARQTVWQQTRTAAKYERKYAVSDTVLTWAEAAANRGKPQMVDLAGDKVTELAESLEELISDQLYQSYAGTGGNDITGLMSAIRDPSTATTYGDISSGDAGEWIAGLYYTGAISLALFGTYSLEYLLRNCWFDSIPDLIMTTKSLVGVYSSKLQPSERRQPENGKAGATDLYFLGSAMVADSHCPDDTMIAIDTEQLWLGVDTAYDFKMSAWEDDVDRYNAARMLASFSGNLLCSRRKSLGAYTSIT